MSQQVTEDEKVYEEIYIRGPFGKFIKFIFVLFNIIMALWIGLYWFALSNMTCKQMFPDDFALQATCASNDAIRTGSQVGGMIGTLVLALFWLIGAAVLGILSRVTAKKKLVLSNR